MMEPKEMELKQPALYKLPNEVLFQVTSNLTTSMRTRSNLSHLRNLCLVSKKLLPIAQEVLYTSAILPSSCTCHPTVNAALQLLRTVFEHPALARHIKALDFSAVRRNVSILYRDEYPAKHLDLPALRKLCLTELTKLGYSKGHPWWASLENDVESAYVGVLLCKLPKLAALQYTLKELHRGYAIADPVSALFGVTTLPARLATTLEKKLDTFAADDMTFLRTLNFCKLKVLELSSVNVPTLLQLNGPNTFQGTPQLSELCICLSIFLLDKNCVRDMQVGFCDLINALGCHQLSKLRIKLLHEEYCILQAPCFDVHHFMDQVSCLQSTLKVLEIGFDLHDVPDAWLFMLQSCRFPVVSLTNFSKLEVLQIPQDFICDHEGKFRTFPQGLPKKLRSLEVVCPRRNIIAWAKDLVEAAKGTPDLSDIVLSLRNGVRDPKREFSKNVDAVWSDLFHEHNIKSYLLDVGTGIAEDLLVLHQGDAAMSGVDDDDYWEDAGEDEDDEEESDADSEDDSSTVSASTDEDMPSLEPYDAGSSEESDQPTSHTAIDDWD